MHQQDNQKIKFLMSFINSIQGGILAYYQSSLVNQNILLRDGTYRLEIISTCIIIVCLHTNNRLALGGIRNSKYGSFLSMLSEKIAQMLMDSSIIPAELS